MLGQFWILLYVVIGISGLDEIWSGHDDYNVGRQVIETAKIEDQPGLGSCRWESPPQNGYNFRPCSEGLCRDFVGVHKRNGTIRFTRCDLHFVLVGGSDRDVCLNGNWTSRGHMCIPCGRSSKSFNPYEDLTLIHYGHNSSLGYFPWMAALYTRLDGGKWEQICGGTLISPRVVLSAAHCFFIRENLKPENLRVGLGKLYSSFYQDEKSSVIVSVKEIVRPERYIGVDHLYDLDIALLELSQTVGMSDEIMPACLDWGAAMEPKHDEVGYLAGFGITEQGSPSAVLKWASQKYVDYSNCQGLVAPRDRKLITQDKFCVAEVKGGKADKGDSGGGITFLRGEVHYVYGVVSTKLSADDTNVRLFTYVLNDGHLAWLKRHWRRLLLVSLECLQASDCSGNSVCVQGSCVDNRPPTPGCAPTGIEMGKQISAGTWDTFYGTQFHFSINGRNFFYRHEEKERRWFIHELLPGGAIGEETDSGTWPQYFKSSFPFSLNGRHFFLAQADIGLGRNSWFIRELLPNGKMGIETDKGSWDKFYESMFAYDIKGRLYFYGQSGVLETKGYFWFVNELNGDGKVGADKASGYWKFYYPINAPIKLAGKQFYVGQSKNNNKWWFVNELLPDGQIGQETESGSWQSFYHIVPFSIGCRQFIYRQNTENLTWDISELLPEGKLGSVLDSGHWAHFNDVLFTFSIQGRYFLYGHTKANNDWFIREISFSL